MGAPTLLLVNAWRDKAHLWCAPGGGVDRHASLPDNLRREIYEETGLDVTVGEVCLVNEFNDEERDFHQVDIYFRCSLRRGELCDDWQDPEGIVSHRRWVTRRKVSRRIIIAGFCPMRWTGRAVPVRTRTAANERI